MYAKIFASLYQGTLRGHSHGLLVFTNLLAHCDAAGFADIHPRAIAEETGLTIQQVMGAIEYLEQPEIDFCLDAFDKHKIVKADDNRSWGWRVINHQKYRQMRNEENRRNQNKVAQKRFRERKNNKEPLTIASKTT